MDGEEHIDTDHGIPDQEFPRSNSREEYKIRYPHLPNRIIDNLVKNDVYISIINWDKVISNLNGFKWLIDATFKDKENCFYDLSRPMRRNNS